MKKIILGPVASGKTYKKIRPAILSHKGQIIFISMKDEVSYLNLKSLFVKKKVFNDEGSFDNSIISDCSNESNVFIQCYNEEECSLVLKLLTETPVLSNENTLLIIDEGLYILGHNPWKTLENLSDDNANILVTFIINKSINKTELEQRKMFDRALQKWQIESL